MPVGTILGSDVPSIHRVVLDISHTCQCPARAAKNHQNPGNLLQKSWQATLVIDSWGNANEFAVWTNLFNFLGICRQRYQWTPGRWSLDLQNTYGLHVTHLITNIHLYTSSLGKFVLCKRHTQTRQGKTPTLDNVRKGNCMD